MTVEKNAFDGNTDVIGITFSSAGTLALRCLKNRRTFAWLPTAGGLAIGATAAIKTRIDEGAIVDHEARAISTDVYQFPAPESVVRDIAKGKSIALRITAAASSVDYRFSLNGARRIADEVLKACPPDASRP